MLEGVQCECPEGLSWVRTGTLVRVKLFRLGEIGFLQCRPSCRVSRTWILLK
jgi:hypothetical protein